MLRVFPNEEFKEITFERELNSRYAISNYGRMIKFKETFLDGKLLKGSLTSGFQSFGYSYKENGKKRYKHVYFYKLVANYFLPQPSPDKCHVIHLDHNLANDFIGNLKWVTEKERLEHRKTNPKVIEGIKKTTAFTIKSDGHKLTSTEVMHLKKQMINPARKTKLKTLAKRYGISEMQLYRIKRGENWGHIKI